MRQTLPVIPKDDTESNRQERDKGTEYPTMTLAPPRTLDPFGPSSFSWRAWRFVLRNAANLGLTTELTSENTKPTRCLSVRTTTDSSPCALCSVFVFLVFIPLSESGFSASLWFFFLLACLAVHFGLWVEPGNLTGGVSSI